MHNGSSCRADAPESLYRDSHAILGTGLVDQDCKIEQEASDVMERKPAARLLIADDHKLLADACKSLLEPEFQVVGVVTDGRALLKAAATLKPDVIILDIAMPQLNGLDAGEQIKHKMPSVKLVFLTMNLVP